MAAKEEKGAVETVTDAINEGDKALDKAIPGSVFAVVGLMYPFILVVVLIGIALLFWMF